MFSEKDDPGCLGNTVTISAHAAMQGTMLYTLTKFKMKPKNHGFQVRNLPFLLEPFSGGTIFSTLGGSKRCKFYFSY